MIEIILGLFIALLWGLAPIVQKQLLNDLSPKTVMLIINFIIAFILIIFSYYNKETIKNDLKILNSKHIKLFLFVAIFGSLIPGYIYYNILSKNDSFKVVITTSLYPIFSLIFARILLNEKIAPELYVIALAISIVVIKYAHKN